MHKRRIGWLLLAALVLVAGAGLVYYWSLPQVIAIYPEPGATAIQASDSLRVGFSRSMQRSSVESRLVTNPSRSGTFSWEGNTLIFTPDQPWSSSAVVQARLDPGARSAGFLSLPLRQGVSWQFTVGNPLLAYLYPSDASADIYLLDPSNGAITRLTDAPGTVLDYSVSKNGAGIYFNASQSDGSTTLYVLDRLTGETHTLLKCPQAACRYPQISPQGDMLAYERTELSSPGQLNLSRVWLLPLSPSETGAVPLPAGEPRLVADPTHRTQQPQWTSKSLLSYYDYNRSAFIVQDTQGVEIVQFPSQTGFAGVWNPQGDKYVIPEIYINEITDPNALPNLETIQNSHLLEYNLDGNVKDLTSADDVEDSSPAFSPDGKTLAFGRKFLDTVRFTPGRQLWWMNADGAQPRAVTQDPNYTHYDIAWSPDGAHIAYVRFNKDSLVDPPELWLMDSSGAAATRLITGGYSPEWVP
jgi:dipeptidyl aminopeptidase/acylaminoacyl peptidase